MRGRGGGLKFEKNAEKNNNNKTTPKKKFGIGSPVFCTFFIHPKPYNIGPALHQPRAFFYFSESGRGRIGGTSSTY